MTLIPYLKTLLCLILFSVLCSQRVSFLYSSAAAFPAPQGVYSMTSHELMTKLEETAQTAIAQRGLPQESEHSRHHLEGNPPALYDKEVHLNTLRALKTGILKLIEQASLKTGPSKKLLVPSSTFQRLNYQAYIMGSLMTQIAEKAQLQKDHLEALRVQREEIDTRALLEESEQAQEIIDREEGEALGPTGGLVVEADLQRVEIDPYTNKLSFRHERPRSKKQPKKKQKTRTPAKSERRNPPSAPIMMSAPPLPAFSVVKKPEAAAALNSEPLLSKAAPPAIIPSAAPPLPVLKAEPKPNEKASSPPLLPILPAKEKKEEKKSVKEKMKQAPSEILKKTGIPQAIKNVSKSIQNVQKSVTKSISSVNKAASNTLKKVNQSVVKTLSSAKKLVSKTVKLKKVAKPKGLSASKKKKK